MEIISKALAVIEPGEDDNTQPNGSFHVILSSELKDRDGETLRRDEWETLPDWINFDIDHAMSVEKTVGSGTPTIEDDGNVHVHGTYASTALAQDVRTLVNEKHIRNTSVTFMTTKTQKDGKTSVKRELLNGAFVAVPSNRDAIVLESKSVDTKAGARNNAADQKTVQAIHDAAAALGASCTPSAEQDAASGEADGANKTLDAAQVEAMITAAFTKAASDSGYEPTPYHRDPDETVQCPECGKFDAPDAQFCDQCGTKLAGRDDVKVAKAASDVAAKAMSDGMDRVAELAKAVDAALDEACDLIDGVNLDGVPAEVRQALDLVAAASESVDELLDVLGVDDPDDEDDAGEKSASGVEVKSVSDKPWSDFSAADYSLEQYRAATLIHPAEPSDSKDDYKLPVKEPDGTVNRNAVHAAASALAGGRGGVDATTEQKEKAAKTLVGLYRNQLKEDPPDSLLSLAGESPKDNKDAKSADAAAADVKSAAAVSADEEAELRLRARALLITTQAQAA